MPVFGHFLKILEFEKKHHPVLYPIIAYIQDEFGTPPPKITGIVFSSKPCLILNSPDVMTDLFVTKNKYFDKHPSTGTIVSLVAGDSILFSKSTLKWSQKRKAISSSLYKEKLIKMTEIMKAIVNETLIEWEKKKTIELVGETSILLMKIILACAFGRKN